MQRLSAVALPEMAWALFQAWLTRKLSVLLPVDGIPKAVMAACLRTHSEMFSKIAVALSALAWQLR